MTSLHLTHARVGPYLPGTWNLDKTSLINSTEHAHLLQMIETARDLSISDFALTLHIPDEEVKGQLRKDTDDWRFDAFAFWARDPLNSRPESIRSPRKYSNWEDYIPWQYNSLKLEASYVVKRGGLEVIKAVRDHGLDFGFSCSGTVNDFDNNFDGDSATESEDGGWKGDVFDLE